MPNCAANRYPSITSFTSSKRITRLIVILALTRAQTGSRLESDWPKNLTDRAFTSRFISLEMRFRTTSVIVGKRRAQLGTTVAWTVSFGPNGQQRSDSTGTTNLSPNPIRTRFIQYPLRLPALPALTSRSATMKSSPEMSHQTQHRPERLRPALRPDRHLAGYSTPWATWTTTKFPT